MNTRIKTEYAEFEEVTKNDERLYKSNLPALRYELPRHPLMTGVETEATKRLQAEIELDKKLGLKHQAEATGKCQLASDIDDLTN